MFSHFLPIKLQTAEHPGLPLYHANTAKTAMAITCSRMAILFWITFSVYFSP
jgi:hypothetical protein